MSGCGRCTVTGYKHHITNAIVFPDLNAPKMRDEAFRNNVYKKKTDTALTELNIDMVQDFVVADSLHLIDLGITKTILKGYMLGRLTNVEAKWSSHQISRINEYLNSVKAPIEIKSQRAIRSLIEIANWKGREYRNFNF